jgi:hypothetical protein
VDIKGSLKLKTLGLFILIIVLLVRIGKDNSNKYNNKSNMAYLIILRKFSLNGMDQKSFFFILNTIMNDVSFRMEVYDDKSLAINHEYDEGIYFFSFN